jgi:hypothetical protein
MLRSDLGLTDRGHPGGSVLTAAGVVRRLRYPAVCACGAELVAGTPAVWDRAARRVWCLPCTGPVPMGPAPGPVVVDPGRAGASLQRTAETRRAARDARVRAAHPWSGGLRLAVFAEPASTTAFARGAAGERRLAAELERACRGRVLFLHNRRHRAGRSGGDLDHVAVAPGGVFVIDAKTLTGARVSVRASGGLFTPKAAALRVSGHDRSAFVEGSIRQLAAVRAALAADDDITGAGAVAVTGVLCFLDASIAGSRWRPPQVDGVQIRSPAGTVRLLRGAGPLGPEDRRVVWEHLAKRLPPA